MKFALPLATILLVTMTLCSPGPAASDPRCETAARYDAMREGANCFNPPISCDVVRAKVAEYGRIRAIAWALRNGFTLADVAKVRRSCAPLGAS